MLRGCWGWLKKEMFHNWVVLECSAFEACHTVCKIKVSTFQKTYTED
jgi:hypothetical protein